MMRRRCFHMPLLFLIAPILLSSRGIIATAQQGQTADAITGRVLSDDGNPLVNAKVYANEAEARGPNRITRSAITDDEGFFRLTRLPPGEYYISCSAAGYLAAAVSATERPTKPNDRYFRPGSSVTITLKKGGVITGRVTDAEDRAVAAIPVSLEYVRDDHDRPMSATDVGQEEWTDDRGVYRFYSLRSGSYLVRVGGRWRRQDRGPSSFDTDAPTYYASATRETAEEVKVRAGEETTGIDIRYRGERGYAIRGTIAGTDFNRPAHLRLNHWPSGAQAGFTYARVEDQALKFDFEGLPNGEYELIADRMVSDDDDGAASPPRRVAIKGADVNGIEMRLIPRSSISGRLVIAEGSAVCQPEQRRQLSDVSLILYRDGAARPDPPFYRANQQGEVAAPGLEAGRYRLGARLPLLGWYVREITQSGPAPTNRPVDVSRQGLMLRPGERKTGITVTMAEGAALLGGRVVPAAEGARLPARVRVHLVPAEAGSVDNVLRYAETNTRDDGSFAFRHLAPGRYWILARSVPEEEPSKQPLRPAAWDAESRTKLWRDARAAKAAIELQPCQNVTGHVLRYDAQ
jgi:protocatechuate 3,4-dioxygenase beta subunit